MLQCKSEKAILYIRSYTDTLLSVINCIHRKTTYLCFCCDSFYATDLVLGLEWKTGFLFNHQTWEYDGGAKSVSYVKETHNWKIYIRWKRKKIMNWMLINKINQYFFRYENVFDNTDVFLQTVLQSSWLI